MSGSKSRRPGRKPYADKKGLAERLSPADRTSIAATRPVQSPGPVEGRLLVVGVIAALVISAIDCADPMTWLLEVVWILIGLPLLIWQWPRFPLTRLLCWLLAAHALVLMIGGHYTYAKVPAGLWLQDALGLARNHYDRLGHLMQGFVPAVLVRELLLRSSPLPRGRWLFVLVTCACLAFSAFFEMIEWWSALLWGGRADAFLATQGDVWDTQWDMFCALIGALVSQVVLARLHDRQLGLPPR
jgi:putative membrane protein